MNTSSVANNDRRDDAKIHNGAKRVLIFSLAYYPKYVGGAEVAIKEITDRMPSLNPSPLGEGSGERLEGVLASEFEFHMVTLRFDSNLPKIEQVGNVLVHRIGFASPSPSMADLKRFPLFLNKFFFQALAPLYALKLHKQYHYDGLWAMMAHSVGIAAGIFKLLAPHVKYVLTLQEGDPPRHIERLAWPAWPFFKRAFTSADRVQVISTFLGNWAMRMGYKGEPILIPNAVDTKRFSAPYSNEELSLLKERLGKKAGDVFLITTSRLVKKNAVDDVIRSLRALPDNVHFLVLGIGPDEKKLRALAKKSGVERRTHFLGQIAHADLPKYLKVSDIFIRASRSEGMGNSFIEAFAAGIPVIATQEGGLADFLFDARRNPHAPTTGWAVTKDAPLEIALVVKEILNHPAMVAKVVLTARELAFKEYDWNRIAKDMRERVFSLF